MYQVVPEMPVFRSEVESRSHDWPSLVERDGYAVVPEVLDPGRIAELAEAIESLEHDVGALERGGSVYAMRNLLGALPAVRELARSGAMTTLARRILGPTAFVVRGLLFDKTPEANWLVPWHQDLTIAVKRRTEAAGYGPWTVKGGIPHVRPPVEVLKRMVTLRVHLDDSGASSGPLRVVPGSHASGRLEAQATRQWLQSVGPRTCHVGRGGVLIMRPLILHASSPADTPARRRVIHLEYAAAPLPGGVEWFESEIPDP